MKESDLIAKAHETRVVVQLANLANARRELLQAQRGFSDEGLATGVFRFTESADLGDLYALEIEVVNAPPGRSAEEFEDAIRSAVGLRDFADSLTSAGCGEFFDLTIDLERFHADFIAPLEQCLRESGVRLNA